MGRTLPAQFDADGKQICGARTAKGPCKRPPGKNGTDRCHIHGDRSLSGAANPAYIDGRSSRKLPKGYHEHYLDALNNPQYLSMREDIALLEARLRVILEQADPESTERTLRTARDLFRKATIATNAKNMTKARECMAELELVLNAGVDQASLWQDAIDVIEQKRKLGESERKLLMDAQSVVTADQFASYNQQITDILMSEIHDRTVLRRVLTAIGNAGR